MSLAATTAWEVRTTGSNSNGGGFSNRASVTLGTDYSQQDAAQYSGTNLAVDATDNKKVSSATHNFVAADIGNMIHITAGAGWTTGFYEIVAVASNKATLDRTPAATSTTGGTWALGGALQTIQAAIDAQDSATHGAGETSFGGQKIWVKSGTYTLTAALNPANSANAFSDYGQPIDIIGYGTVRGDEQRPLIRTSSAIVMWNGGSQYGWRLNNFEFDGQSTATAGIQNGNSYGCAIHNCYIHDINGIGIYQQSVQGDLTGCEIANCTSYGVQLAAGARLYDCYVHDCDDYGVYINDGIGAGVLFSVIANNAKGIYAGYSSSVNNSVIWGNTGNGIDFYNAAGLFSTIRDCIIGSNGGYGRKGNVTPQWYDYTVGAYYPVKQTPRSIGYNAYYNNTSGHLDTTYDDYGSGEVILTGDPFTDSATGDFSLNSTAGAGADCRSTGSPGTIAGISPVGYIDMGALQHGLVAGQFARPASDVASGNWTPRRSKEH